MREWTGEGGVLLGGGKGRDSNGPSGGSGRVTVLPP